MEDNEAAAPWDTFSEDKAPWDDVSDQTSKPMSGSWNDYIFQHTAAGRVLSKFGQGASDGWGATMNTLAPTEEGILKSVPDLYQVYKDNNEQTTKAFSEAFTRPSIWASILKRIELSPIAALSAGLGAIAEGGIQFGQEFINTAKERQEQRHFLPDILGPVMGESGEIIQSYASGQNFGELGTLHGPVEQKPIVKPQIAEYQGGISEGLPFKGELPPEQPTIAPEQFQETPGFYRDRGYQHPYNEQQDIWPSLNILADSRARGFIGEGDIGYFNTFPLDERVAEARTQAAIEARLTEPILPKPPVTDPYVIARGVDPELMARHDTTQFKLEEARQAKDELLKGTSSFPDIEFVEDEINRLNELKKLNSKQQSRLEDLYTFRKDYKKFLQAQDDVEKLDLELRDMSTEVSNILEYSKSLIPDIQAKQQAEWYKAATKYSEEALKADEIQRAKSLEYSESIPPLGPEDSVVDHIAKLEQHIQQNMIEIPDTPDKFRLKQEATPGASRKPSQPVSKSSGTQTSTGNTKGSLKPVEGTGDKKIRGLSLSTEASAIDKQLIDSFEGLPEYNSVSKLEQAQIANALVASDLDRAIDILEGRKSLPKDLLLTSLYKAVQLKAEASGDIDLIRQLANSQATASVTTMAQNLAMLADKEKYSAINAIREIQEAKQARAKKKGQFEKVIQEVVKSIKQSMREATPNKKTWRDYLEDIKCK